MSKRDFEGRETNQSRKEQSSSHFLLGAIIGGVVGAAAVLLFAPKSGKQMRDSITGQAGSIIDKTEPLRENVKSKTISLSQGLVQQSTDLLNKVKGKKSTEEEEDSEITYISLETPKPSSETETLDSDELRKKLAEAQKAFDKEESKVKH